MSHETLRGPGLRDVERFAPPTEDPRPGRAEGPRVVRIRAGVPGRVFDPGELFRHRDLLRSLVERDLKVRYKQTVLGVAWVVLQPLLAALIFSFVFGVVAKLPSDGRPYLLFAFAGLTAWNVFAQAVARASLSLVNNAYLIAKVYFPRVLIPLSSAGASLVDAGVSLVVLFVLMAVYGVRPGWPLLALPVWVAGLLAMALGVSLGAGALMVRYRDVSHVIPVALQLGLYVSPVAWSTAAVPGRFRWVLEVNPLSALLEGFRWSLLGDAAPAALSVAYALAASVLCLWAGSLVFRRQEACFADVI